MSVITSVCVRSSARNSRIASIAGEQALGDQLFDRVHGGRFLRLGQLRGEEHEQITRPIETSEAVQTLRIFEMTIRR